jgi:hypothetical protein
MLRLLVAALLVIVISGGCSKPESEGTGHLESEGSSLGQGMFDGTLEVGFPAKDVKPGAQLGFSFPVINNVDKEPVTLLGVKLVHVPQGVKVLRYALLSLHETDGQLLDSKPGDGEVDDYERFPNHLAERITFRAHTLSFYYPVVTLKVTGPVNGSASGCEYRYKKGGRTYSQTLECKFLFRDS